MSKLLENLASCLSAAGEASKRLRAYVGEIDRFLSPAQTPEPSEAEDVHHFGMSTSENQPFMGETVVPFELLQRIPWDWAEQFEFI